VAGVVSFISPSSTRDTCPRRIYKLTGRFINVFIELDKLEFV